MKIVNNQHSNYLDSLSEKEKKALHIAKSHLGILFNLDKTNGYIQWVLKQTKEKS